MLEGEKMSVTAGVILAKVAVAVASDKRVQNFILAVIVGIIAFIIIIFGTFFTIMNSMTSGNSEIVSMAFCSSQSEISMDIPENDAESLNTSIATIQESFKKIDTTVDETKLEQSEYDLIKYPSRGSCLYKCGNERYNLQVIAPEYKSKLFGVGGGK
jgi:hypothetical protein